MATLPTLPAPAVDPSRPASGARRIARNLARLLGGKVVAGLLSLVYLVVVTHRLGARDYGVLVLINGYAIAVGSLVAFSGFHGVVRYGQLALERGDRAGLARLVRFMAVLELGCGLVAILVAAALVPLVAGRFGWSPEAARLAVPYSLAVLGTVRATPQGLLQMADRFDLIAAHGTVSPLIRFAGTMAVWVGGGGLPAFLLVWLASSVAEGGAMWLLAAGSWRRLTGGAPLAGPWRGPAAPGFGRFILATNADLTLRELAPNLAPLTVGWLLGPAAAGLLTLAQRSTNALQQPAMLLSQASYAVLAEQAAQGAIAQLRATVARSAALAAAGAVPVVAVLAIWGEALLRLVGGRSFGTGATLVPLLAAGSMAALVAAPVAAGLAAIGRPHRSVTVTMAVNLGLFPLLPLLLRAMGVAGAGWQLLLQNLAAAALLALFLSRDTRG